MERYFYTLRNSFTREPFSVFMTPDSSPIVFFFRPCLNLIYIKSVGDRGIKIGSLNRAGKITPNCLFTSLISINYIDF